MSTGELEPLGPDYLPTREALHRIAEELVAPARKPHNEIALKATPGGFGTPVFEFQGVQWRVRVEGAELVVHEGDVERRAPLTTLADGAALIGELRADWQDADPSEVNLWPEHFDVAIEAGDEAAGRRANYGFSPGDAGHEEPYLYVGPWNDGVTGEIWNAKGFTGAELGYGELAAAQDPRAAALEFCRDSAAAL